MTIVGFTGPAGTGKTWSLMQALMARVAAVPLRDGQRVLGLTFMHGSRRRMHERLSASTLRGRFECQTLDRFAWEVVRRWRSRRVDSVTAQDGVSGSQYDATCSAAARLLAASEVAAWVARAFPIVVVDEFQDCSVERLAIVQALASAVDLFVAADEFQDLRAAEQNVSVSWLRAQSSVSALTKVHRTSCGGLIAAAVAIRAGSTVVDGDGFKIESVPSKDLAAAKITFVIAGAASRDIAVLSPSRRENAPFVDQAVEFVSTKKYGKKKNVGPYTVRWEDVADEIAREAREALAIDGEDDCIVSAAQIRGLSHVVLGKALERWLDHQRRVCGCESFSAAEVRDQIQRAAQQRRSFGSDSGRRAMTIQQAKNREFEHVVVLWPYQATANPEMGRRLLYNAVTRAKKSALVLVQDPTGARLAKPPFR